MILNLKKAVQLVDRNLVNDWVFDLVVSKPFRTANPEEETRGIDGYIGEVPISIKPTNYKTKPSLGERIDASIDFYEKKKDGILVRFE